MLIFLCHREQRHVSAQLTPAYNRRKLLLERNKQSERSAGQYVAHGTRWRVAELSCAAGVPALSKGMP